MKINLYQQGIKTLKILRVIDKDLAKCKQTLNIKSIIGKIAELEDLQQKKKTIEAYFEQPTESGVYFCDLNRLDRHEDIDCRDILSDNYLAFRADGSELIKKKQAFTRRIDQIVKGESMFAAFQELNKHMGDEDLYEEIVWCWFLLSKYVKFYKTTQFCLDMLRKRYPKDEFLSTKQAMLYSQTDRFKELDEFLVKWKRMKVKKYQNIMLTLMQKMYMKHNKDEDRAMKVTKEIQKRNPQDVYIQIQLLYFNLAITKDMETAEKNYKFIRSHVEGQNKVIEQQYVFHKYEKCKKLMIQLNAPFYTEAQRKSDNLIISTKSIEMASRRATVSVISNNLTQLGENMRSKNYEKNRLEGFQQQLEEIEKAQNLKKSNANIAKFCDAFLEECERTYNSCRYISDSAIEKEIKGDPSLSVVFFCMEKLAPFGTTAAKGLMLVLKQMKKKILQNQFRDIKKFAASHEDFQSQIHKIFNTLILKDDFQQLIIKLERDANTKWKGFFKFVKGFIDKGQKKNPFERLGNSAAIGFMQNFIFDARRTKASLHVIVESIYMDLQFGFYSLSMPPDTALKSNNFSSVYYGFLDMSRYLYEASVNELHSHYPTEVNTKFVLLYKRSELFRTRSESLILRAQKLYSFFKTESNLDDVIKTVFDLKINQGEPIHHKLDDILANLEYYDFGLDDYYQGILYLANRKKIEQDKDLKKFFAPSNTLAKRVGGILAVMALTELDLKRSENRSMSDLVEDNIVGLELSRKGICQILFGKCTMKIYDLEEELT